MQFSHEYTHGEEVKTRLKKTFLFLRGDVCSRFLSEIQNFKNDENQKLAEKRKNPKPPTYKTIVRYKGF